MDENSSGVLGVLGLIGLVVLYFVLRKFLPSFATAMLVLGGIVIALLVILVAVVIYFAFKKPKDTETSTEVSAVLAKGRTTLVELRRMGMRIKYQEIRNRNEDICKAAEKILHALKEQPKDIPKARQFFNYYLPTLGSILQKYARLEAAGIPAEQVTESAVTSLGYIKTAMEKQYANLFESDILDLSVEMETLTLICKRDGLLDTEDCEEKTEETKITLTL